MLKKAIRLLMQILGSCLVAFGLVLLGSAVYATLTTPADQLNESTIGYAAGVVLMAAGGIVLFASKSALGK